MTAQGQRKRRWSVMPEPVKQELRDLLLNTELSAAECLRQLGFKYHYRSTTQIIKECRRYVRPGQWVNQKTGQLCPANFCTAMCASEKTGLSKKTLWRRVMEQGFVRERHAASISRYLVFTDADIDTIKTLGKNPGDNNAILTREDVASIRELARAGRTHAEIAKRYPVSRRQISRIVDGTRWKS